MSSLHGPRSNVVLRSNATFDPHAIALQTTGDTGRITWSENAWPVRSVGAGLAAVGMY